MHAGVVDGLSPEAKVSLMLAVLDDLEGGAEVLASSLVALACPAMELCTLGWTNPSKLWVGA